ncbi:efflux RND transporter periplasmic adaptor subunit [Alteromonas oceanisediminis]|uniref:efflux RND transporter periplasmic adaptor subunit n=1 Tax=Alteromonas oceanisediminis TaxID=2836180 RepID=UPI001BDAEF9D|nr:efflux RND transporter periplasmic adaptor subunit [Alteromonas oceanisediminis]MBT0586118.1 efflux RND transporter periplasmic adaptor subunit [Alteromonas oceanisediminis]
MSDHRSGAHKALFTLVAVCFSGLVVLLFFAGYGKAQSDAPQASPPTVEAATLVWQQQFEKIQRVVGRVESSNTAQLGFERAGLVNKVHVDDGAVVKQGQILASLDQDILNSQREQAAASVTRAQAQQTLAQSSFERIRGLVQSKLESQQRLDEAKQTLDVARAAVREATANLNTVNVNIAKSTLTAPFDGEITSRFVDQGTVVSQGQPVFELFATTARDVRIPMPAQLISQVSVGETYVLKDGSTHFTAVLKAIGKLRRLSTRTVDAVFELTDAATVDVLPGDLLSLDVKVEVRESGAWVPVGALSHGLRGLWNIYSVSQDGQSTVTARSVEVLYSDGQFAFIRGAIAPEMLVVVSGTHRLAPGQAVAVTRVSETDVAGRD